MSKFDDNIPQGIKNVNEKIGTLYSERASLDWGHDCDCEFCDEPSEVPEETEIRAAEIEKEIKELQLERQRLTRYAENRGIKLDKELTE